MYVSGEVAMSLRPDPVGPVPEETAQVARDAFARGTAWMRLRDELGPIYRDATFAALFSLRGRPAEAPWRLALVSVMQFAERLSDRRAADAVRGRIDWKYALGLPLDDPGFDSSVLCEFRARLLQGGAEQQLLDTLPHALNVLAELAPSWLLEHAESDWAERYGRSWDDDRLPTSQEERDQVATTVGA